MKLREFIVTDAIRPGTGRRPTATGRSANWSRPWPTAGALPADGGRRGRRRAGQARAERLDRVRQGRRRPARQAPEGEEDGRHARPQRGGDRLCRAGPPAGLQHRAAAQSPENQPQQHLQAMNIVFSNLQKDMFRRFLRQSDHPRGDRGPARRGRPGKVKEAGRTLRRVASWHDRTLSHPQLPTRHQQPRFTCPPLPEKSSSPTSSGCTPGRRCSSWTWPTSSRRDVTVYKGGEEPGEADGKSVMQMIILAATEGTPLRDRGRRRRRRGGRAEAGRAVREQVRRRVNEKSCRLSVASCQ